MRLYPLEQQVLSIKGNAARFLNGLTSNSLDQPHNAFLNVSGRIIATFDQVQIGDDEFLIAVAKPALEKFKAHVDKFARLNKTAIEPMALNVYFDLDAQTPLVAGEYAIAQNAGRILWTARDLAVDVSADEFNLFRLNAQIPLHTVDYNDEFILNVHMTRFVSFTKGCFLGQEPVAKVYNRSKPSWQLAVRYADELTSDQKLKMTSEAKDPASGRLKGFVFVANMLQ